MICATKSPTVRSQLQDTQARYSREVAIIRKKGGTASAQSCHKLKRVGRLHSRYGSQLRSGAQMIARNLCNTNTATPREKSFITLGQQVVSRTIGNDQKCQQSKRRGNQLPASVVNFFESGSRSGRNQGIVLDEVEEDDGVQAQSAAPQVGDQSHELRSRTMCCDGSIFFQCSLPNP